MSTELNLIPFKFIEDIQWSSLFEGNVSVKYNQVQDLRSKKLSKSDYEKISGNPNAYFLRWVLKDEVYLFLKERNISLDTLVVREIDFTNIDYEVKFIPPSMPKNLINMDHLELEATKNRFINLKIACRKEELKKKYSYFPLYGNISKDDLVMITLSLQ